MRALEKSKQCKSHGQKVSPNEAEDVPCAMPGVVEAAVIGVPDLILVQAIKAFVVYRGTSPSAAQVLAYCRSRLEDPMIRNELSFETSSPKTVPENRSKGRNQ